MITIALNILLVLLLIAALVYAWRLERRLAGLEKNRQAMEKFVMEFGGTIARAERAIETLRDTAQESGSAIDQNLTRSAEMRDELTFLIDAADKIATRLTNETSAAQQASSERKIAAAAPPPVQPKPEPKPLTPEKTSEKANEKKLPQWVKPLAGQMAGQGDVKPAETSGMVKETLKSQAERELKDALERMR